MKNFFSMVFAILIISVCTFAQSPLPDYVPANGLVGWWPFNNNANDHSGNSNNGVVNNAIPTTDRFGNSNAAYKFNGVDSRIDVADAASLRCRKLTLSAWVHCSSFAQTNQVIYKGSMFGEGEAYTLTVSPEARFYSGSKSGSNCVAGVGWIVSPASVAIIDTSWTHLVATFDGATYSLYKNGQLDTSIGASGIIDSCLGGGLRFGYDHLRYYPISTGDPFIGSIDDIGIWNRALSASEIQQLFGGTADCGNGKLGVNVCNPKRSLHVKDVLRLEPRNTEPSNPEKGDIYFDGNTNKLRVFDGTVWQNCW